MFQENGNALAINSISDCLQDFFVQGDLPKYKVRIFQSLLTQTPFSVCCMQPGTSNEVKSSFFATVTLGQENWCQVRTQDLASKKRPKKGNITLLERYPHSKCFREFLSKYSGVRKGQLVSRQKALNLAKTVDVTFPVISHELNSTLKMFFW